MEDTMLAVRNFDADYIVWDLDDLERGRPMLGRDAFHASASDALKYYAMQIREAALGIAGDLACRPKDIKIEANELADKALIEKWGFTAV
jgi:hypothetical protein